MYGTTGRPPLDDDDQSDSSNSTDFVSHPFQAFRPSLFTALKSPEDGSDEISPNNNAANDTLPSLHDKSWIGARMSPIHSIHDDNNNNNDQQQVNNNNFTRQPSGFVSLSQQHAPSAGHARTEYPPFGIHPLQPTTTKWPLSPVSATSQYSVFWNGGTFVCLISGLCLFSMGAYDIYYYYFSSSAVNPLWDTSWTLPYGKPSDEASVIWGALVPATILFGNNYSYWRLLTSALQSNSVLEWCVLTLAWYLVQKSSVHPISWTTLVAVYALSTLIGQLWLLALSLASSYNSTTMLVAHCAAWGTSGVLCFVGMVRPSRRFGCFMMCIVLVILSLMQNFTQSNPLPMVVGCTSSSFVGWALYGSQMFQPPQTLRLTQKPDQLPIPILTGQHHQDQDRGQIHSSVRLCCGGLVMILWVLPLLILAYLDYFRDASSSSYMGEELDNSNEENNSESSVQ